MNATPLISVGVPTYNRPDGLRKTLEGITGQTYRNLEIIVSDNCSPLPEVQQVLAEFSEKDARIRVHRQMENIGAMKNFHFVLNEAKAEYFLWAADDDEWQGNTFLENLFEFSPKFILTFPEAIVRSEDNRYTALLESYGSCATQSDYIKNFISYGWGHPIYGLYNLKLFQKHNLKFEFDNDLLYYNEGTFLHKIFLAGPVKYVKQSKMLYGTGSTKPSWDQRINDYMQYLRRTIVIYENSNLNIEEKAKFVGLIMDVYLAYLRSLLMELTPSVNSQVAEEKKMKTKSEKILDRLKLATSALINGR